MIALLLAAPNPLDAILAPGAKLEKVASGFQFVEGPAWTRKGALVFSDIPASRLYELEPDGRVRVLDGASEHANGNTIDPQGRLVTCHHGSRSVTRGAVVLAARFDGKRLNSPNDVVVRSDGTIYFTDPPYGIRREQEELGFYGVFKIDKSGDVRPVARDFVKPNGLALSPDEKTLYVDDTDRGKIYAFDVLPTGDLARERPFADLHGPKPGAPDGMKVDSAGNVYCSGPGGVHVLDKAGQELGLIDVPEVVTNLAWGGPDAKALYVTAGTSVYRIRCRVRGCRW